VNLEQYDVETTNDYLEYSFFSHGPKGAIKKIVRFNKVVASSLTYYNLGFGDWNQDENSIDDFIVSDNLDTERVLVTVAATVLDFTNHYPGSFILVQGSTLSRTRLYQIGINKYWHEIALMFEIYGFVENKGFRYFEQGRNYLAFLVKRK
jgi:hypothetical protein